MKSLIPLFLFFLSTLNIAFAQESEPETTERYTLTELGVNSTFFVANFLTFSGNTPVSVDPYAVQLKILANGTDGFRMGIGGNYRSLDQSEDGDLDKTHSGSANLRLGYEHRTQVAKKWKIFFGSDIVWGYEVNSSRTNNGFQNVTVKNIARSLGTGLVFGIQFFATKRVSMGTETSAQFLFTEFEEKTDIGGNLPDAESVKSELATFNFMLPTSIYINIALGKQK